MASDGEVAPDRDVPPRATSAQWLIYPEAMIQIIKIELQDILPIKVVAFSPHQSQFRPKSAKQQPPRLSQAPELTTR